MKKILCLFLCVALFIAGCSTLKEDNQINVDAGWSKQLEENILAEEEPLRITLHVYQEDTEKLAVSTKEITPNAKKSKATLVFEQFVEAMNLSGIGKHRVSLVLDQVVVSGDIAIIQLRSGIYLLDWLHYVIATAAANTALENLPVQYAYVMIDGYSTQVAGVPTGLLKKSSPDVLAQYQALEIQNEALVSSYTVQLPLFYVDEETGYLLPHVREVVLQKDGTLEGNTKTLLQEMAVHWQELDENGEKPAVIKQESWTRQRETEEHEEDVFVTKEADMVSFLQAEQFMIRDERIQSKLVAIFLTIMPLQKDARQMSFYLYDTPYSIGWELAIRLIGTNLTLFFPETELRALVERKKAVPAIQAHLWDTYLEELRTGVTDEDGLLSALPEGMGKRDLLSVQKLGTQLEINFSAEFERSLDKLPPEHQLMCIYAIVNTMCNIEGIRTVRFLREGQPINIIHEEKEINLYAPLMPNLGLIQG
ncbi:MAG: GerMN domain-containing protein [Christensenellaceae bacterium]|jgi:hypothetical protein